MSKAYGTATEPLSTSPLTRLGIFGLGGLMVKGIPYVYRLLGGSIEFKPDTLTGTVDVFRTVATNEGPVSRAYLEYLKARNRIMTKVALKIKDVAKVEARKLQRTTIESLYELENLVLLDTYEDIIDTLYNSGTWRLCVDRTKEDFRCLGFADEPYHKRGETLEGISYRIFLPDYSIAPQTRPAINKTVWQLIRRFQGYNAVGASLEYLYLDRLFKEGSKFGVSTVMQILAKLDQTPSIKAVPELQAYLTDEIIKIGVFRQVQNNLKVEEILTPCKYDLIKPSNSDKALTVTLGNITETWSKTQVKKNDTGGFTIRVMPLMDNIRYSNDLPEPRLQAQKILKDVKIGKPNRNLELVSIKQLNGGADGTKAVLTYIYDRDFGDWHGSLNMESNGIEVAHMIPSFFGIIRPDDINTDVERRHWKVQYKTREEWQELVSDFESMSMSEKYMYGIHSFSGPNHYLVDSSSFLRSNPVALGEDNKVFDAIDLYSQ
jgi:hypothetical protein